MECLNVAGDVVPDRECEGVKPDTEESCDMGVCAKGWYHTAWSEEVVNHRYFTCLLTKLTILLGQKRLLAIDILHVY